MHPPSKLPKITNPTIHLRITALLYRVHVPPREGIRERSTHRDLSSARENTFSVAAPYRVSGRGDPSLRATIPSRRTRFNLTRRLWSPSAWAILLAAWKHLPEGDRWALVPPIRALAKL